MAGPYVSRFDAGVQIAIFPLFGCFSAAWGIGATESEFGRLSYLKRHAADFTLLVAAGCFAGLGYYVYLYVFSSDDLFSLSGAAVGVFWGAALLFVAAVVLFRRETRQSMALICCSCGVSIYLIEAALQVYSLMRAPLPWEVGRGGMITVVAKLRKQGLEAYTGTFALDLDPDLQGLKPLAQLSNTWTVDCQEAGPPLAYKTDEHGFHNPPGLWAHPKWQVVALGDSFTQGFCVPSDSNMVALIRRVYPLTLNLATAGDSPLEEFAKLREFVAPYKPRHVLWFFYEGNDLRDMMRRKDFNVFKAYLKSDSFTQQLLSRQREVDEILRDRVLRAWHDLPQYQRLLSKEEPLSEEELEKLADDELSQRVTQNARYRLNMFAKFTEIRHHLGLLGLRQKDAPDDAYRLLERILEKSKALIESWDGTLTFVYVTGVESYNGTARETSRKRVFALVERLGLPIVNIDDAFLAHGNPTSLFAWGKYGGHFNSEGYRVASEEILYYLSAR